MTKTPTPRRVYAVHHAGTGTTRLVRAVNVATAVRHVVRTDYTAKVATQDDLIDLLSAGTRVEDAGADDGEPPVKVLRLVATVAEPPPERDPRVPDMFDDAPAAPVSPVAGALSDAPMTAPISPDAVDHLQSCGINIVAADHVEDVLAMVPPLAAGGFAPCGRALGNCGKATQTCGRDGCGVEVVEMPPQHAPIAAVLDGLASGAQESAAEQPGELAGASSAVDDDGGRELTAAEQLVYEAQGAARFAQHHGSELKRQAEAHAARAGGKIVAKYRNPDDGSTWTGRGLKPRWVVQALEAGRTQDEFLIENQGAQA